MEPIVPFEPVLTEQIPSGAHWVAQVKWDVVRILTYCNGQTLRLFNRKLNERTAQYPELQPIHRYCSASSVILDGEMIAFTAGKPSFYEIMRRDSIRKLDNLEKAKREVSITYMIFDILFYNGEWILEQPLEERQSLLQKIISLQPDIQLVQNFPNGEHLFQAIQTQGMEGIVCKDRTSTYRLGGEDARWQKYKNYRDLIAAIGGFTLQSGVVNSVLMGLYDHAGSFWYIGHSGTGRLTQQDWRDLTATLQPLVIKECPFVAKPQRTNEAFWVKPSLTAKIQFAEWTPHRTLRQASIQAFVSVPLELCTF